MPNTHDLSRGWLLTEFENGAMAISCRDPKVGGVALHPEQAARLRSYFRGDETVAENASKVSVWRLADDATAYGERAGRFIIVTPDGEDDLLTTTWRTAEEAEAVARALGLKVVPLENAA